MISEQKKVEHPTWDSNLEGTLPYWWICRRNFSRGWWSCQSDSGNLYSSQVGGKRDADNKTQWSYLLRYFNHSIVHLFFSSVKRSFNNYVDRKRGKGSVESPNLVTWQRVGIMLNSTIVHSRGESYKIAPQLVHVVVEWPLRIKHSVSPNSQSVKSVSNCA